MKPSSPKGNRVVLLILLTFVLVLIVATSLAWIYLAQTKENLTPPPLPLITENEPPAATEIPASPLAPTQEPPIPEKVVLALPFFPQAPTGNWDAIHEETCEEASLLMVYHRLNQSPIGDKESELTEILDTESKLGFGPSITLEQLKLVSESGLGMKSGHIVQLESIDQIKKELANNRPVIIPAAGRTLKNPNFRNGGPIYHMLVIIGYEGNEFITNDPGTRKGEGYRYDQNVIFDAVHDWDTTNINNGQKRYLVYK